MQIVWVRPPWSSQLSDGERSFYVGRETSSGFLRVTCAEPYFASEGLVCRREDMDGEVRQVGLLVVGEEDQQVMARKVKMAANSLPRIVNCTRSTYY